MMDAQTAIETAGRALEYVGSNWGDLATGAGLLATWWAGRRIVQRRRARREARRG